MLRTLGTGLGTGPAGQTIPPTDKSCDRHDKSERMLTYVAVTGTPLRDKSSFIDVGLSVESWGKKSRAS